MSYITTSRLEELERLAKAKNAVVVLAQENEIQLDLDSEDAYNTFRRNWKRAKSLPEFSKATGEWWDSSTKGHRHCVIRLQTPMKAHLRILWQSSLGSDCIREHLNMQRWWEQGSSSNMALFRPVQATIKKLKI